MCDLWWVVLLIIGCTTRRINTETIRDILIDAPIGDKLADLVSNEEFIKSLEKREFPGRGVEMTAKSLIDIPDNAEPSMGRQRRDALDQFDILVVMSDYQLYLSKLEEAHMLYGPINGSYGIIDVSVYVNTRIIGVGTDNMVYVDFTPHVDMKSIWLGPYSGSCCIISLATMPDGRLLGITTDNKVAMATPDHETSSGWWHKPIEGSGNILKVEVFGQGQVLLGIDDTFHLVRNGRPEAGSFWVPMDHDFADYEFIDIARIDNGDPILAPRPHESDSSYYILAVCGLVFFDLADISPQEGECFRDPRGRDYRGTKAVTVNGDPCLKWTESGGLYTPDNFPHSGIGDHNYCRNPDEGPMVYCMTANPEASWGRCNIGLPGENCGEEEPHPTIETAEEVEHATDILSGKRNVHDVITVGSDLSLYIGEAVDGVYEYNGPVPGTCCVVDVVLLEDGSLVGVAQDNYLYIKTINGLPGWHQRLSDTCCVISISLLADGSYIAVGKDHQLWTRRSLEGPWLGPALEAKNLVKVAEIPGEDIILGIDFKYNLLAHDAKSGGPWNLVEIDTHGMPVMDITVTNDGSYSLLLLQLSANGHIMISITKGTLPHEYHNVSPSQGARKTPVKTSTVPSDLPTAPSTGHWSFRGAHTDSFNKPVHDSSKMAIGVSVGIIVGALTVTAIGLLVRRYIKRSEDSTAFITRTRFDVAGTVKEEHKV